MAHTTDFHGGLIYYGTPGSALAKCSCIIADTLEEYGHSVEQFSALASDVISLACDQYRLVLRLTEMSGTPRTDSVQPELQRVEIALKPIFPRHCDTELSEMLMAIMLYRLVPALDADEIEWMAPDATLTKDQFLGVFADIRPSQPLPQTAPQSRFAPIEETAAELELHCAAMQPQISHKAEVTTKPVPHSRFAAWASSLLHSNELRYATRVPPLAACAVLLQSSGVL